MSFFQKNLEALSAHDPPLAALLHNTPIPSDYLPTTGSDGSPTYLRTIPTAPKRLDWLGRTSMPAASADPITANLDPVTGLGLSIGSGLEWLHFLNRLPARQMLYVYEPDPAQIRMVLEVADLSNALATRKLVLLTGPPAEAADALAAFLQINIGFAPPTVLHALPSMDPNQRNALLTAGELIVRRAVTDRTRLAATLTSKLQTLTPKSPALAILITPLYPAERPLHQHLANIPTLQIDRHDSSSPTLLLQTLLDHAPAKILSDLRRPELACIPDALPIETWIALLSIPRAHPPLAPHDRLIVHHATQKRLLESGGIPPTQIEIRPLDPPTNLTRHPPKPGRRIALLADLPPSDIDALKISLPTHQAVFAAARESIAADYLTLHLNSVPDLHRRALQKAGVDPATNDPALGPAMLRIIRDILLPAIAPLTLAAQLAKENFELTLLGNWPNWFPHSNVKLNPFSAPAFPILDETAIFLHFSPLGLVSPLIWPIIAAGIPIVSPQHPTDPLPGSLPQLLTEPDFAHPRPRDLFQTLRSLLSDPARRNALAHSAQQRLLQG